MRESVHRHLNFASIDENPNPAWNQIRTTQFSKVSDAEGDFAMQPRLHDPVAMAMQQHGGRVKSSERPDDRAAESEQCSDSEVRIISRHTLVRTSESKEH